MEKADDNKWKFDLLSFFYGFLSGIVGLCWGVVLLVLIFG
jgi:hypothetical protein